VLLGVSLGGMGRFFENWGCWVRWDDVWIGFMFNIIDYLKFLLRMKMRFWFDWIVFVMFVHLEDLVPVSFY
jgi:hypothetical protein